MYGDALPDSSYAPYAVEEGGGSGMTLPSRMNKTFPAEDRLPDNTGFDTAAF